MHRLDFRASGSLLPVGSFVLICVLVGFSLGLSPARFSVNFAYVRLMKSLSTATGSWSFPDIVPPFIHVSSNSARNLPLAVRQAYFEGDCPSIPQLVAAAAEPFAPDPITDFVMGHLYYRCGMPDLALKSWRRSNAFGYFLNQCTVRLRQEQNEHARRDCALAAQLNPDSALAFDYLGRVNTRLREYQEAVVNYSTAIAIDESIPGLLLRAGSAYERIGDLQAAEKYLLRALSYNSRDARAYFILGRVAYQQSDYRKALRSVEQAIQIEPAYTNAYLLLGDILCATHQWEQARTSFLQAGNLDPGNQLAIEKADSAQTLCR